jgi:hypothetical protein
MSCAADALWRRADARFVISISDSTANCRYSRSSQQDSTVGEVEMIAEPIREPSCMHGLPCRAVR